MRRFLTTLLIASGALLAAAAGCKGQDELGAGGSQRAITPSKMRLKEAPADGAVDAIVRSAMASAASEKRRLVVYVGAPWCEPCERFHHAAERGELDATFPNVDLLGFDHDRDGERLAAAGYVSKLIPVFALPGPDGHSSGKQVEGGIKGEGAVGFMAPRLAKMLEE